MSGSTRRSGFRRVVLAAAAFAAASAALAAPAAAASTIAAWDVSGQSGYGTQGLAPQTADPHVTVGGLTRGGGLATTGTAAGRAWGAVGFVSTSESAAITANQVVTFTVTAANGFVVSFNSINPFDYRRSTQGPPNGALQYQVGNGAFTDVTSTLSYSINTSAGGSLGPIDLSGVSALQGVPGGTTVTFRIVNWNGAANSTWYIFDKAANSNPDFTVLGTVVAPTSVSVETAADGSGTVVPAQTVLNGHGLTVYAVARDAGNAFVANVPATWSLASVTDGVVAGDLVPSGDGKSAVFTAHAAGTAAIHAAATGLSSTDSGVITAQGPQSNPSATGFANPAAAAANQSVLLEVGVVAGSNPTSTGITVTGDLTSLGAGAGAAFHDDGANGDLAAGDGIFSYQVTIGGAVAGGAKLIPIAVADAQNRSTTTSISLKVLGALTIFHVNDTHARLTPHKWIVPAHAPVSSSFEDVGGAAYLATAILQSTATTPDALVIDAGDISEGNPLGDIGGNLSMVQFYDMLNMKLLAQRGRGMDAVVVGNHDVRDIAYINNLDSLHASGVPVISVNVRDISTHQPHFAPYTIVTVNGVKIGILGYTTQSAAVGASLSSTLEVADCDWNSTDATKIHIASYVNELRNNQGCDMVIFAVHVGHSALATDTTIDAAPAAALLADDGAAKLPEIAVTGHWHTWSESVWQPDSLHYKTIFTEAGSYMHYLGELHVDGHGNFVSSTSHPIRNAVYAPDPDVQAFIDGLISQYDAAHPLAYNAVLGYTADDLLLDERMKWWTSDEFPWSGNDTAGQWIADAVAWKCAALFGQCDLSFEVGGGVRSDIPAGPVTYTQAYETFPWSDDTFTRVNMTGQEIIDFIKTTNCDAAFSRRLHVVAHDGVPTSVTFDGQPIDPAHTYLVGITNYIYAHPPAGWTWSDLSPLNMNVLARDGIIEYMQQFPIESPYTVGGPRYELDTQFSGEYRAVVTMLNDNDTKPVFEDAFIRLLRATPETLSRRGTKPVPTSLVNADGSINQANRLAENELYRSYLGFKAGALVPGDIIEVSGKGGFFDGDPEFVDQEGIYANGVEFKLVGHDASLAEPTAMPSINSFMDDAHKNHYVSFLARKSATTATVIDQQGTSLKLWDATAFANKTIPGSTNDLLIVTGIPTSESFSLRFRTATVALAANQGIADFPPVSTVTSHVDALPPEGTDPVVTLTSTAGATPSLRTLSPAADAQVETGAPTSNFGTTNNIFIESSSTTSFGDERGWLRFDLSSLPGGAVIESASLEMFCFNAKGPSLLTEVHGAPDNWAESGASGITFANQPAFGPTLSTQTLNAGATSVLYDWDVTSFVQGELAGDKMVSLVVKAAVEGSTASPAPAYGFDAKEFGSNAPVLKVTTQASGATVAKVEFFYRYSADGVTWTAWTSAGVDTAAPYALAFNYPNGFGSYEFYSVATDTLGATEGAPASAQAATRHEADPEYGTAAYVTLDGLAQPFTGAGIAATITTVPPGIAVDVTYDGVWDLPVHPGTYAVAATVVEPSYSGSATGTLTIAQASQTIDFPILDPVPISASPLTLNLTASSGLPVSLASSNPAVVTVSGNVLTLVAPGSTTITATQDGNADFAAATPVARTLVVSASPATVMLGNLSQTYDGSPKAVSVTTTPPGLAVSVTYSGGSAVPVHAGSYPVVATVVQTGFTGSASGMLTVAQASQTITFPVLDGVPLSLGTIGLTGTASSGLPVSFASSNPAVATVSGNVATLVAAGTTTITASQAGNADYVAATPVARTLSVAPSGTQVPALPPSALAPLAALLLAIGTAGAARAVRRRRASR
jgi:2',3'-cyclic-nucleotide 2'-phosphodiesterase (5'-nucleotidase family)